MLMDGVYLMYMKFGFPIHVMRESTFYNFIHKKAKAQDKESVDTGM